MKKALFYLGIMAAAAVTLSSAYYVSYKSSLERHQREETKTLTETEQVPLIEEAAIVDTIKEDKVTNRTKYKLITYDAQSNAYKEEVKTVLPAFIGKNREDLINYLSEYMNNLPLEEIKSGLLAYDLQSFSQSEIVLTKTYDAQSMPYEYFIGLSGYEVVVYYCDKKTVFEYTGIDARELSVQDQKTLLDGVYALDKQELYGILENYSS